MKMCVTGGAGFIGSNLVDRLITMGHDVVVIDDLSLGKIENLPDDKNLTFMKKSICDNIANDIECCDVVFHVAALPRVQFSIKYPIETNRANIDGTLNVINACQEKGIKRVVFSSSSSIYGDQARLPLTESMRPNPMSPYALHKLVGEYYCNLFHRIHGVETVSLRYFNVFGPKQNPEGDYACLIPKFLRFMAEGKKPTIYGDGKQTRDFTFVSDVVEANIAAATTSNTEAFGDFFNIGGGQNRSVNEVVSSINNVVGERIEPIHGPAVIEPKNTLADISKSKRVLDWQPKIKFEEGLARTLEFIKRSA